MWTLPYWEITHSFPKIPPAKQTKRTAIKLLLYKAWFTRYHKHKGKTKGKSQACDIRISIRSYSPSISQEQNKRRKRQKFLLFCLRKSQRRSHALFSLLMLMFMSLVWIRLKETRHQIISIVDPNCVNDKCFR